MRSDRMQPLWNASAGLQQAIEVDNATEKNFKIGGGSEHSSPVQPKPALETFCSGILSEDRNVCKWLPDRGLPDSMTESQADILTKGYTKIWDYVTSRRLD